MFEECCSCQGWAPSETGEWCIMCDGSGQIWVDQYNEIQDELEEQHTPK